jgi:hypothetical protein
VLVEVVFTQDFSRKLGTASDVLVTATDSTGAWGANRVECEATSKLFSVSSPEPGPASNTVLVQARYADADLIRKACAPGRTPPTDVVGPAPSGEAWINEDEIQEGQFIMDLATRKLAKV